MIGALFGLKLLTYIAVFLQEDSGQCSRILPLPKDKTPDLLEHDEYEEEVPSKSAELV